MEIRLAVLRVDLSHGTSEVMLFMETVFGFRPIIGWSNVSGFLDFTDTLVGIFSHISCKGGSNDMICSGDA